MSGYELHKVLVALPVGMMLSIDYEKTGINADGITNVVRLSWLGSDHVIIERGGYNLNDALDMIMNEIKKGIKK